MKSIFKSNKMKNKSKIFKVTTGSILFLFILLAQSIAQNDISKMHLVYQVQSMNSIKPIKIEYNDTLTADLYIPSTKAAAQTFPCVIFISGYARINFRHVQVYNDWARLMAANGLIGIVYETNAPNIDFDKLIEYLIANANSLQLDKAKIGIWSCSANSLLAINKMTESSKFKCYSIYYGLTLTGNSEYVNEAEELSKKNGFFFSVKNDYNSPMPILIVRAGKDSYTIILKSIDEFVKSLLAKNIHFELINYPDGQHAFDILDDNATSKEIITRTVEFFKKELNR